MRAKVATAQAPTGVELVVPDKAAADTPESEVWLQDGLLDGFRYKRAPKLCEAGPGDAADEALMSALAAAAPGSAEALLYRGPQFQMWAGTLRPGAGAGKGTGVLALQDIPEGAFLVEFWGEPITDEQLRARMGGAAAYGEQARFLQVLPGMDGYLPPPGGVVAIDASRIGNISRFINRSVDGNLAPCVDVSEARPRLLLYTSRAISKNQELLMSY